MIPLRRKFQQPPASAILRKGSPLLRGLNVFNHFAAGGRDIAGRKATALDTGAAIVSGRFGKAMRAGSGPDGLRIGGGVDANALSSSTASTVMILVRIESLGTRRGILGDHNSGGSANSISFEQTAANGWVIQHVNVSPVAIPPTTSGTVTVGYHWLELVHDSAVPSLKSYVDGTEAGSDTGSGAAGARRAGTDYRIGRAGAFTGNPFDGDIAFHALWSRPLSNAERALVRATISREFFEPQTLPLDDVAAAGGTTWTASLTEASSSSDAVTSALTLASDLTESVTAADAFTSALTLVSDLNEALSPSEAINVANTVVATLTEAATTADAFTSVVTLVSALAETMTASEALTAALTAVAVLTETPSLSETLTNDASYVVDQTETVSLSESVTSALTLVSLLTEAVTAADSAAGTLTSVAALTELASALDALVASYPAVYSKSLTESVTLTEIISLATLLHVISARLYLVPDEDRTYLFED